MLESKIEENKSGLEFNFPSKSKCASLNFEIRIFGANLTEPYCSMFIINITIFIGAKTYKVIEEKLLVHDSQEPAAHRKQTHRSTMYIVLAHIGEHMSVLVYTHIGTKLTLIHEHRSTNKYRQGIQGLVFKVHLCRV